MNDIQIFKEKEINNYLSNIDLTNMDINSMKMELKGILGEEPAIKLNYVTETLLNEDGSDSKKIEHLETVTVTFTINKELIPGKDIPFPISKTFVVG